MIFVVKIGGKTREKNEDCESDNLSGIKLQDVQNTVIEFLKEDRLFRRQADVMIQMIWDPMKYMIYPQNLGDGSSKCDYMFILAHGSIDIKKWDP